MGGWEGTAYGVGTPQDAMAPGCWSQNKGGTPHGAPGDRGGWGGGDERRWVLSNRAAAPTPERGSMGRGPPAASLGAPQKGRGCGVTARPWGQTANSGEPPRHAKQGGGNGPLPPGGAVGQRGGPLPILRQHSAPTGCPLWQRARKERGARPPPRLETPRWARRGAGRASEPHGVGVGAARSLWGAEGRRHTDRRTQGGFEPPTRKRGRAPRTPGSPQPHGRGRTNSHGRTRHPTAGRRGCPIATA